MKKCKLLLLLSCIFCHHLIAQNVGIGTATPTEKFTVRADGVGISQETSSGFTKIGFFTSGPTAYVQTHTNHPLLFSTNNQAAQMILTQNGHFGIGVNTPDYLLDVAGRMRLRNERAGITAGILLNDLSNNGIIGFVGIADANTMGFYGYPGGWGLGMNTNTGNIGIKTLAPTNRLQIGSLGANTFNGNDLAIGNGTNAMVVYQSNASTLLASTTDIVLMPRNNGNGRVGINTNTPRAPLDVQNEVPCAVSNSEFAYYALGHSNFQAVPNTGGTVGSQVNVSIFASSRVLASEFNAYSDARIKSITGKSNTAKDLDIINVLQVTDYTMRDKAKYGNKTYKKVIAQEVEKVYPQVVSKHTDFIPNVYQVTSKIEKTTNGYLLTFEGNHNISKSAKKLRVLLSEGKSMEQFDIVSIPADNKVEIKATALKTDKAFVYGEEVDDFRTVDYEGLTTLNISATQELSKLVKRQQEAIDALTAEIKKMKEQSIVGIRTN